MPVHDWSRVFNGAFRAFHVGRIAEIQKALNGGVLTPDYVAMAEKVATTSAQAEAEPFTRRQQSVVIRQANDDRIIALVEILSVGNFDAGPPRAAYVEPVAVGDTLIDMPLFLAPDRYVSVPLDATYEAVHRGVPRRFRDVLGSRD